MKVNYVSISNAIQDFIQDNELEHVEISQYKLKKWATDCLRWLHTPQQLAHRVTILQVENSRAVLPDDFQILSQVAANVLISQPCDCSIDPDQECCNRQTRSNSRISKGRREDIVQWVQGTMESGCELEINLVCATCHKTGCSCGTPAVEVDVDRTWELSHPEIYYGHYDKIGRFGYGPGPWSDYYSTSKFQLMRHASNDFHGLQRLIGECPNVDCSDCIHEFIIQLPYIEVDFEKGELLLSYLGSVMDEDGDLMIPDHPDVHDAIYWHLVHKYYWPDDTSVGQMKSEKGLLRREEAIGRAKSALEMPDFHQIRNYLENQHMKRLPNFHRKDRLGKLSKDEYEIYRDRLNGR